MLNMKRQPAWPVNTQPPNGIATSSRFPRFNASALRFNLGAGRREFVTLHHDFTRLREGGKLGLRCARWLHGLFSC